MIIQNVHDKFFKEAFSRIDVATNFLEEMVNNEFVQKLHLNTLKLENGSFIDEQLEESFADILYTCQYGKEAKTVKIALLYEHKSYREEYPHWQLVKYMVNVWQSGLKQKKVKPIPIIPIVIYHGKVAWKYQSMREYFEDLEEDFFKYIPDFEYHLVDLSTFSNQKITNFRNKFLAISALLFKHSRFKKYIQKIENEFIELMKLIDNQEGNVFTKAIVLYIQNTEQLTITKLFTIFSKVSINIKNTVMTTAEQLINQGINQGVQINKVNTVKKGYLNGISSSMLANISDLSIEQVEEIIAKVKLSLL
jgi:predicted transposase/invertase (TIGR01784 family)